MGKQLDETNPFKLHAPDVQIELFYYVIGEKTQTTIQIKILLVYMPHIS